MRLYACSEEIYFIRYCNLCFIFFPSFKMQLIFFPYETRAHKNNSRRESYPMFAQSNLIEFCDSKCFRPKKNVKFAFQITFLSGGLARTKYGLWWRKKKGEQEDNSFWNICLKRFSSTENNERRLVEKTALVGAPFRSCEEMIRKSCEIWDCKISVKETKEQRFAVEIISPPSAILWVDILHTFRSECASVHEKNPKPFSMIRG